MFNLKKLFSPKPEDLKEAALTKDAIAELLKVSQRESSITALSPTITSR